MQGPLSAREVIQCVEQGNLISWFQQVNPLPYDVELTQYEEQMRAGRVTAETVEYLEHVLSTEYWNKLPLRQTGPTFSSLSLWKRAGGEEPSFGLDGSG